MATFTDTSSALAREAHVTPQTIMLYARLGLLRFVKASNGTRLFAPGQATKVRKLCAQRMAARGRKKGAAARK